MLKILFIAGQSIKSNSSVTMMNVAYINGLVQLGHDVRIITSKLPEGHIATDGGFELPKEVKIDEYSLGSTFSIMSTKKKARGLLNSIVSQAKGILRKVYYKFSIYDSQRSWVKNVDKIDLKNEHFNLVISSSDPKHSHIFAEKLIERNQVKCDSWLQLWGDPMYLDITRKGALLKRRLLLEEKRLISKANKIIYVSPFTADEQKKIFPEYANKMDYVLIPYIKRDEEVSLNINGDQMVFGYYGDYSTKIRNLKPLYDAAIESSLKLIIRGNTDKPLTSSSNIEVGNRISIKELEALEKKTDVFIHLCNSRGTQIPAKVYYYSGTKKPILFILDGESKKTRNFFQKYERYIFCENNTKDILNTINKIRLNGFGEKETRIMDELSPVSIAEELLKKVRN